MLIRHGITSAAASSASSAGKCASGCAAGSVIGGPKGGCWPLQLQSGLAVEPEQLRGGPIGGRSQRPGRRWWSRRRRSAAASGHRLVYRRAGQKAGHQRLVARHLPDLGAAGAPHAALELVLKPRQPAVALHVAASACSVVQRLHPADVAALPGDVGLRQAGSRQAAAARRWPLQG